MRNILALIGALVVGFAIVGWYLEWYKLGSAPAPDGHRTINVDVNQKKIVEDVKAGGQKVGSVISNQGGDGSVVPSIPTPKNEKKVEAQPAGFQFNPDGSISIIPPYKNVGQ